MTDNERRAFFDYLRDQHGTTSFCYHPREQVLECSITSVDGDVFTGRAPYEGPWDQEHEHGKAPVMRAAFRQAFRNVLEHVRYLIDEEYELTT